MLKTLSIVVLLALAGAPAFAQQKTITVADFVGTWNIEVMSHQVALVIEPQEGNKVTGTMMMMGRDLPLRGELSGSSISFVGVKDVESHVESAHAGGGGTAGNQNAGANAKPIVVTLLDDGTLTGEMMTSGGPVKWIGERLKAKKKG